MTDAARRLRRAGGLKWTFYDEEILPAWVAEMDFGLAPSIKRALHDAIDNGLTGYPYPDAETAAASAATRFWAERFDWNVDSSWVFPAPDVIEGITKAIVHLTRPESAVVLHTPVYFPFFSMVENADRRIIEAPSHVDESGRYTLELEAIERGLEDGAGSVVICNPWNPTGRVLTKSELEEVIEMAAHHDARVIADEIHGPIVYDGNVHVPAATIDPERVITVTAASKAWNLPGLKCAQVVLTAEADREVWKKSFAPHEVGVGTFGLLASTAAYDGGQNWFAGVLSKLESNRSLLTDLVATHLPTTRFYPPEGTYLGWLDMGSYGLSDVHEFLKSEARVAMTAGSPFRGGAGNHVRINFATEPEILVEILERIGSAIAGSAGPR